MWMNGYWMYPYCNVHQSVTDTTWPPHLVLHSDLVALLPAQHRSQGGQLSARGPLLQDVLAQAVGHLEGDGGEHVLHVLLQRITGDKSQSEVRIAIGNHNRSQKLLSQSEITIRNHNHNQKPLSQSETTITIINHNHNQKSESQIRITTTNHN